MSKAKGDYTILIPIVLFLALAGIVAYSIINRNKQPISVITPIVGNVTVSPGVDTSKIV